MEQLLHQAELVVASEERCLEAVDALEPADAGDDGAGGVEADGLRLPLQGVLAGVGVGDRRRGE